MGLSIKLIAVGRLKERFWKEAVEEYSKRLGAYANLSVHEVSDRSLAVLPNPGQILEEEARDILSCLKNQQAKGLRLLLDIKGEPTSSEDLAKLIADQEASGQPQLTFIIGGSHGVAPEVRQIADRRLSFGPLTLPHNLARVVLLEQIYRAFKINRGEPYHK
jgi:23S rRNA (pseudouridine1915-N3)-methyltransferase